MNRPDKGLYIGNHVWCSQHVKFTKDAHVEDNSVIALGTLVCGHYGEPNVVIGGNPGKIIKRGITWSRQNTYQLDTSIQG